jgi:hypothetical protein
MVSPTFYKNLVTTTQRPGEGYAVNFLRYFYQSISLDGLTGDFRLKAEEAKINLFRQLSENTGLNLESDQYLSDNSSYIFTFQRQYTINEDASLFGPLFYPLFLATFVVAIFQKSKLTKGYLSFPSYYLCFLHSARWF